MLNIEELLQKSKEERNKEILEFKNLDELRDFAKQLYEKVQKDGKEPGVLKFYDNLGIYQIQQQINLALNQYPEPEIIHDKIAIDREFDDQERRLNAIFEDINNGKMPESRWHELLHENLASDTMMSSKTFLAHAAVKLNDYAFTKVFKHFELIMGEELFKNYLATPNKIGNSDGMDIFELYLKSSKEKISDKKKQVINRYYNQKKVENVQNIENTDTHTTSAHKSADESHVRALKEFLRTNSKAQNIDVEYVKPARKGDDPRNVKFKNRGNFDALVDANIADLKGNLEEISELDNAAIYENYLKHNDIAKFKNISYGDLDEKDKQQFDKKINFFRFQVETGLRLINGGYIAYNKKMTLGLSIKEMLGVAYHHTHINGELDVERFISLVRQMHDMQRGYNIDYNQDKPEEYEFNAGLPDSPRCEPGCTNSLTSALASQLPKIYSINVITPDTIRHNIKETYKELINKNLDYIKANISADERVVWVTTKKITGKIREHLEKEYKEKREAEFEGDYKGNIADSSFDQIVASALDNVAIPKELTAIASIDSASAKDIMSSIEEGKLPFLNLKEDFSYESVLVNLIKIKPGLKEAIEQKLESLDLANSAADRRFVSFISKSGLYKDKVIFKLEGKSVSVGDIAGLSEKGIAVAVKGEEIAKKVLEENLPGLFWLYEQKVGFSEKDMDKNKALLWAAENGYTDIAKMLIEKSVDLNVKDKYGETALHHAARNGHTEIATMLIEKGADVNVKDRYGETALHHAARNGHTEIATMLIENGADVNVKDDYDHTALIMAAFSGHTGIAKMLIENGADVNVKNNYGYTALHLAVLNGDTKIAKMLIEKGADVNVWDSYGKTVLQKVIEQGNNELRELLIEKGAYVPLSFALERADEELLKALINNGLDINEKAEYGRTALHRAVYNGDTKRAKMLIENGADVNIKDKGSNTALILAAQNGHTAIAKMLIEKGADVNVKNIRNNTALIVAIRNNYKKVAELLIEKGTDVNIKDQEDYTALYYAVEKIIINENAQPDNTEVINAKIVELLIEKGAALNTGHRDGIRVLDWAIEKGEMEIANLIIKRIDSLNEKYYQGIIHIAVRKNEIDTVKLLIENGALPNQKNNRGKTVLEIALENNNIRIAKLLIEKGARLTKSAISEISREDDKKELKALEAVFKKQYKNHVSPVHKNLLKAIDSADEYHAHKIKRVLAAHPEIKYHEQKTSDGEKLTPIQYAIKHDKTDSLTAILESGYDKKYRKHLNEALHLAVEKNNVKAAEKLIDSGADPMSWHKGKRSFHILDKKGEEYLPMLELFVKKGILNPYKDKLPTVAELNKNHLKDLIFAKDNKYGNTPLHIALHKSKDLKTVLADNLDNINSKNANGKTPLDLAKTKEERLLLVENGADPKYITSELTKEERQNLNNRYKDYQNLMVNSKKYLTKTFKTSKNVKEFSNRIQEMMFYDERAIFQNLGEKEYKEKIHELTDRLFNEMEYKKSDLQQENIFKRFINGLKKIFGLDKFNSHMSKISEEFKKGLEEMNKEKISPARGG